MISDMFTVIPLSRGQWKLERKLLRPYRARSWRDTSLRLKRVIFSDHMLTVLTRGE